MSEQNSDFTRRKFIATSVGCLAAASLAGVAPGVATAEDKKSTATKGKMVERKLGKTGLTLPIVSMGAGAANDPGLVVACYEAGMRHFDTAVSYAYGRNEQMVGQALAKMGVRKQSVIATKLHTTAQRASITSPAQSKKMMASTMEASLKRLKTDYVDILYIHDVRDAATCTDEAIMEGLAEIKKQGKARFIGISTHSDMANVVNATTDAGIYDVVLTSINFTMVNDTALLNAIKKAADKGLGVIGMKTQAGGGNFPNPDTQRDYSGEVINSAAFKWAMRNENICTAITGISNHDHMRFNTGYAADLDMTAEESKFLADNSIILSMGFCSQCRQCLASCPKNSEIPDLMRTHMYATQYADFAKAKRTLKTIPNGLGLDACASCPSCTASCANSVDIPKKIEQLKEIYA
ncbi:MAG: aldo/keto reductase [candidate division Zixibacteria bacterium]|nr:aldo/keto reductase [candidate division Zixibacteria bacterium]MDH3937089.1 aldo/keto reductase [candidate division Zixibacteria bacterium]MDH4033851.1 aldo/keto reductase [candidate division Zixibacteria bacterium]